MNSFKTAKTSRLIIGSSIAAIFVVGLILYFYFTSGTNGSLSEAHAHEATDENHGAKEKGTEIVRLSPEDIERFKIHIEEAGPGKLKIERIYTGEVRSSQDNLAYAVPPYTGIVKSVKKKLGDIVEANETLAVIHSNDTLVDYELKSDLKGVIVKRYITLGEFLDGSIPAYEIADLSVVWVDISIYQKDLSFVSKGQKIVIFDVQASKLSEGEIGYVDPLVNEATRNGLARVYLDNTDYYWKPGMFVTAKVTITESEESVAIKKTALQLVNGHKSVFIKKGEGFIAKRIKIGDEDSSLVAILEGINVGDKYVSDGSFVLKAELQKEELGGGHGH